MEINNQILEARIISLKRKIEKINTEKEVSVSVADAQINTLYDEIDYLSEILRGDNNE